MFGGSKYGNAESSFIPIFKQEEDSEMTPMVNGFVTPNCIGQSSGSNISTKV
jgi:hypothetical protein